MTTKNRWPNIYKIGIGAFYGMGIGYFIGFMMSNITIYSQASLALGILGEIIGGIVFIGFDGQMRGNGLAIASSCLGAIIITVVMLNFYRLYIRQLTYDIYSLDYFDRLFIQPGGALLAFMFGPVIGSTLGTLVAFGISTYRGKRHA